MQLRTPNPWSVAVFAIIVGAGLGAGTALIRSAATPWQVGDFRPATAADDAAGPRAETSATVHAFGTIGTGATGSHEFTIRNAGLKPLALTKGATSCTCTISDFDRSEGGDPGGTKMVPPGGVTKVTVQWKGKGSGGPFRQQATIFTNDPRRPEIVFVVEGRVVPTWRAVPEAVVFSRLSVTTGDQATVRIYTFGAAAPAAAKASIDHPQAAQFFSLAAAPMAAAEFAAEPGATGGLNLAVEIKPGLPLGPLRQTISVSFRMPDPVTLELPLEGVVAGDLALAGVAWDSSSQVLSLGTVSGKTGLRTQLFLTAKGPHRDAVRPVVREVVPDSLQVDIGESKPVGTGGVVRTPLTIVVPPGSQPANNLCSEQAPPGRIVLDTGHPDTPTLTIRVCIAIGP
jgi:hypothetical protein